jgi:hypothetical protein
MAFSPSDLLKELQSDEIYTQWKKLHSKSYLSHFFCSINSDFILLTPWDLGWYDPNDGKITIFTHLQTGFEIKPADDVFKRDDAKVEELDLNKVKVTLDQADKTFQDNKVELFPKEIFGNGFIILQQFNHQLIWNITYITHSLKFANLKIDAGNGKILEHNLINFVEKQLGKKPN